MVDWPKAEALRPILSDSFTAEKVVSLRGVPAVYDRIVEHRGNTRHAGGSVLVCAGCDSGKGRAPLAISSAKRRDLANTLVYGSGIIADRITLTGHHNRSLVDFALGKLGAWRYMRRSCTGVRAG